MKRLLMVLVALFFMATPAMAGNQPEYDAVGCDATNFFNDFIKYQVCANGVVYTSNLGLVRINEWSDWTDEGIERFWTQAGQLYPDPCFNFGLNFCNNFLFPTQINQEGLYLSALTDPWNEGVYLWRIVLQKKPESDIDLNIRDCVLKHNEFCIWNQAEQTGRYRAPWGQLFFVPTANPQVTARVFPGPLATPGFEYNPAAGIDDSFILDARTIPGLGLVALQNAVFTSKALWEESIVMRLPATGGTNVLGQPEYNLKQGDVIEVVIYVPGNNTVDIRYGQDNVVLKYIGVVGTEYIDDQFCGPCSAICPVNAGSV